MNTRVTLPDGTTTAKVVRFDYKFCIALKLGDIWISSWALTPAAAKRTVEMWQGKIANLEYKIIPL